MKELIEHKAKKVYEYFLDEGFEFEDLEPNFGFIVRTAWAMYKQPGWIDEEKSEFFEVFYNKFQQLSKGE